MMRIITSISVFLVLGAVASADTLVLKDGTFVEGNIVASLSTTVRIETRFGTRTYQRRDIEQILETPEKIDPSAATKFTELPPAVQAVLNAEADYKLGNYERALSRLDPYREDAGSPGVRIRIDWLIIEINERLGHWDTAKKWLEEKKEKGTPREKIRAQAHLDIFEANPDYALSYVGKKHARNFLPTQAMIDRAREKNALRDADLMREALEEYCDQMLVEDKLSVKAFADKLKSRDTYDAIKKLKATGDVEKQLPYAEELRRTEATLYRAQAVLEDYGKAYELDLVRAELIHLLPIFYQLLNELAVVSPENFIPPFDPMTGRLTGQGRQLWQERCDQFLAQAAPVNRLIDYIVEKTERYPRELRDLNTFSKDLQERLSQMINGVKKAKRRTDA